MRVLDSLVHPNALICSVALHTEGTICSRGSLTCCTTVISIGDLMIEGALRGQGPVSFTGTMNTSDSLRPEGTVPLDEALAPV